MWAVHVRQFEYITRTNRHFITLNTLRLLAVVFIPFTTSVSSAYPDLVAARIILPLNFLVLTAVSFWQWWYATHTTPKLYSNLSLADIRSTEIRNEVIIGFAALVVVLSVWFGEWAFAAMLLAGPVTVYVEKRYGLKDTA